METFQSKNQFGVRNYYDIIEETITKLWMKNEAVNAEWKRRERERSDRMMTYSVSWRADCKSI